MKKRKTKRNSTKRNGTKVIIFVLVLALILFLAARCLNKEEMPEGMLAVHFIDVGQGDCELIVTPDGQTMLIDAGIPESGEDIVSYISALGITEIDIFVATHYHEDHIGGSPQVFDAFEILSVLILECEVKTVCAKNLLKDIEEEKSEIVYAERGYEFELGEADFLTLSPEKITDGGGNDDSIVLRMQYGEARYIFTGDAEEKAEKEILSHYSKSELSSDLLKAGHHGSRTSTSDEFLAAVSPNIAIISCGEGNKYGHPHIETVEKLSMSVSYIYRTDVIGSIIILTDGEKIYKK
ncbi:MAG: MBL fold metallo-hydrolase [Ruminococcaceae bacterium]|nr:MBL fold metallo-hydrolase [Oscillospiraceae bacterium]